MKILATADIHLETLELDKMSNYTEYFVSSIKDTRPDVVAFLGDTSDSRNLRVESIEYQLLVLFIQEVEKACIENNATFIILRGTPSHDGDVIENIVRVHNINCIYINTTCVKLIHNIKILFMPEKVYPTYDSFEKEIYMLTVNNKPDIVFFHGTFDFGLRMVHQIDSKFNLGKNVVVDSNKFRKVFKTVAIGGHIHKYCNYNDIYYLGRFINERGRISDDFNTYGLKLIELTDNGYTIKNIDNPYVIVTDLCVLNLHNNTLEEILEVAKKFDAKNTLFVIERNSTSEHKTIQSQFQSIIRPTYIRLRITDNEINEILTDNQLKKHEYKHQDDSVVPLLIDMYNEKYKEILPNDFIETLITKDITN